MEIDDEATTVSSSSSSSSFISSSIYRLVPWWTLPRTGTTYDSYDSYSHSFFLSICEECRVSLDFSRSFPSSGVSGRTGTVGVTREVEVMGIQMKTDPGRTSVFSSKTLRCSESCVWVVRCALNENPSLSSKINKDETDVNFWAGDLVALSCPSWDKVCLGVVQFWDPDEDNALGIAARAMGLSMFAQPQSQDQVDGMDGRDLVNILVCSGANGLDSAGGGWLASESLIGVGNLLTVVSLGNTMTSLRECQALASIRTISRKFQELILNPSEMIKKYNVQTLPELNQQSAVISLPAAPTNVPNALWKVLCENFNYSQLRAIRAACPKATDTVEDCEKSVSTAIKTISDPLKNEKTNLPITLLQGPPGTGKTKVILGLVSVFLGGALDSGKKRQGTKINAGASLRSQNDSDKSIIKSAPVNPFSEKRQNSVRILICAPSNTAIDEIVYRLKTQGYFDANGTKTTNVKLVRVGHVLTGSKYNSTHHGKIHGTCGESNGVSWSPTKPAADDLQDGISREVQQSSLDFLAEKRRVNAIKKRQKVLNIMEYKKDVLENGQANLCT